MLTDKDDDIIQDCVGEHEQLQETKKILQVVSDLKVVKKHVIEIVDVFQLPFNRKTRS
jgi:hypothetical protein